MEGNAKMLQIYELRYSDLLQLSTSYHSSPLLGENGRMKSITKSILEALGPDGPGLLAITGVPNSSVLWRALLPLARKLALLNPDDRKRILKVVEDSNFIFKSLESESLFSVWSSLDLKLNCINDHNLGSDVPLRNPERNVSSFAMQLKYTENKVFMQEDKQSQKEDNHSPGGETDHFSDSIEKQYLDNEFKNLGDSFKELGSCMMELGLRVARICDGEIGGQELEQSLLESHTAKGRLIHYHSALDNKILRKLANSKGTIRNPANSRGNKERSVCSRQMPAENNEIRQFRSNLWQDWHYDYGIFTVLTTPMFLLPQNSLETEAQDPCGYEECTSPCGHLYLQIFDPSKKDIFKVNAPPGSFVIQVGEAADILSKGKLRSTLHSVSRPSQLKNLCREMFVVFLQPAWNKTFSIFDQPIKSSTLPQVKTEYTENEGMITGEIQKIVPPLTSRLKQGMTFAEFSRETTKQYYGEGGLQSNR